MSAFDRIVVPLWMLVPPAERLVIAELLHLPHSGITEIRDQEVVTDGYTNEDLATITVERMAEFVGSEETFSRLWELTVAKARSIVHPPEAILASTPDGVQMVDLSNFKEVSNEEFAANTELPSEVLAKPKKHAKATKAE